ncbi:ras guanine nucleotide exchange factor domain-containing protein, partial [Umbelopsis sp. PMI_123]
LPLIPLSILTKNSLVAAQSLEKAKEALSAVKTSAKSVSTETLRHLYENERIEKARLETLNEQIQSVQSVTAFKWDSDSIAKQIAIINSQLYRNISLENNLAFSDPRETHLLYFTDFHRYLTSSFTHQLIYWSDIYRVADGKVVDPPIQPRDSMVSHAVKIAYLLLHVYRDFSGCLAIMKALSSSEVRRIRRLWTQCPSRSKELYKELIVLLSPANNYRSYQDALVKKLSNISSDSRSKQGMMIAVPWYFPHFNEIRHIAQEYTAGGQDNKSDDKRQRLLSAPGAKKLNDVMAILRKCQSNSSSEWEDYEPKATVKSVSLQGLRKSIDPPIDLLKLAPGNLGVHHWLVSRVYLTKQQLIDESMEVEPLAPGEELLCDNVELNEESYDVISEVDSLLDPLSRRSSTSQQASDQAESPDAIGHGLPNVDETLPSEESAVSHEGTGLNIEWNQAIAQSEPTQTETAEAETVESEIAEAENTQNDSTSHSPEFSDPLRAYSSTMPLESSNSPQPELSTHHVDDDKATEQKHSDVNLPTSNDEAISKPAEPRRDSRKSRLSPSAPTFVPNLMSVSPIPEPIASNLTASPASIQGNVQAEDSESDKWNGYPTPKSEDTNDEEEWTGYPAPSNQTVQDLRRQSSRSSTSEDWKGYQAHKTEDTWKAESRQQASEHDWQGYTLETLDEDELDSSTMMNGEFEKKRRERESFTNFDPL